MPTLNRIGLRHPGRLAERCSAVEQGARGPGGARPVELPRAGAAAARGRASSRATGRSSSRGALGIAMQALVFVHPRPPRAAAGEVVPPARAVAARDDRRLPRGRAARLPRPRGGARRQPPPRPRDGRLHQPRREVARIETHLIFEHVPKPALPVLVDTEPPRRARRGPGRSARPRESGRASLDRDSRQVLLQGGEGALELGREPPAEALEEGADLRHLGRPLAAVHAAAAPAARGRRARGRPVERDSRRHQADRRLRRRPFPSRGRSSTAARAGSRRSPATGSGRRRRCGTSSRGRSRAGA